MSATGVRISRPTKVLYPREGDTRAYTKADVAEHYTRVAPVMVPHLRGRPLVLRRFPDGLDGAGFFQQEASGHFPGWIHTVTVPAENRRGEVHHVVIGEDESAETATETLRYLADQACLEVHRWLSTSAALHRPDLLVIDLDPPPDADLAALRRTARDARDLLDGIGLVPFLQTTGGNGYHVVAPLDAATDYAEVRALARTVAERLADADPARRTTEQRIAARGERIFLDVNRNAYGQTAIAPYSLRARPGAPVATPLDWDELGRVTPGGFTLPGIRRRLARKADPWGHLRGHARSAAAARRALDKR